MHLDLLILVITSSEWISIGSFIIAICSLWVSIKAIKKSARHHRETFEMTRDHNKRSVRPIISLSYFVGNLDNVEKNYFVAFAIKNCGFGPAIIKDLKYNIDNKEFDYIYDICSDYIDQPERIIEISLSNAYTIFNGNDGDAAMSPNESITLFKLVFKDLGHFENFHELMKRVMFKIEYEDVYGEIKRKNSNFTN